MTLPSLQLQGAADVMKRLTSYPKASSLAAVQTHQAHKQPFVSKELSAHLETSTLPQTILPGLISPPWQGLALPWGEAL